MFELCRKIVAGPKKKLQWNGKQLDLTYVTDRLIAMAFPASGLESAYRNSIKDVSQFLHQKHGPNFLIVNVSSRSYDYKLFNNNVIEYEWRDHLSPNLSTLWEIGRAIYEYLKKNKNNVVAVHCNHGKGRTGTSIISFLLFTGFFEKYDEALNFYNKRRFVSLTYGVSQPCQKRYLSYFQILKNREQLSLRLICYKIKNIKLKGLANEKYFLSISSIRLQQTIYKCIRFTQKTYPNVPLMGDICIQLFLDKWNGKEDIAMINCHTFFFDGSESMIKMDEKFLKSISGSKTQQTPSIMTLQTVRQEKFQGRNIKISGKHSADFEIMIEFEWYCHCHLDDVGKLDCPCLKQRQIEQTYWRKTLQNVEVSKKISKLQACSLMSTFEYLHEEKQYQRPQQSHITEKKPFVKGSNGSMPNTQSSPIGSDCSKQDKSQKGQKGMDFPNSLPTNSLNSQTDSYYENDQFQYDLVVVNRNSTNSI